MTDIFGFLTVEQWLNIVRIGVGLWWIKSVFHKDIPKFLRGGMINWSVSLAESHPNEAFGRMMKTMLTSTKSWFPYFQLFGELAVGVGLVFGILTPVAALAGIFMNINFIALAGVKLKDVSINPCFRVEQGQNWVMILIELLVFVTGAWGLWTIDAALGLFPV